MPRDELFKAPLASIPDFAFDESVVQVFDDMINRSVPGYRTLLEGIGLLANQYLKQNDRCYDLGCSIGACTNQILQTLGSRAVVIEAIDASEEMVRRASDLIKDERVTFTCADICQVPVTRAKMVVLNLVLQFIEQDRRQALLKKLYSGLQPNGVLILTEKVISQPLFNQLHLDFKAAKGYSELEIAQKRIALENVMKIDTLDQHLSNLRRLGFRELHVWFQILNWVSILAIK